jgi:hypothetical protein
VSNKNQVTLTFAGDADKLSKAAKEAEAATKGVGEQAKKSGDESKKGFDVATFASVGLADTLGNLTESVDSIRGAFRASSNTAGRLAQAQNDVKQVSVDAEQAQLDLKQAQLDGAQAAGDLRQSTIDLKQAQQDQKQAARDSAQAALDVEQAQLDAKAAQQDYKEAVKEFGANSIEAQQALIDQKQAQEDLKQAQEDAKQATIDQKQAQEDASQATRDGKQAQVDAKQALLDGKQATVDATQAQIDMSNAQTELTDASGWSGWLTTISEVGPGILAIVSSVAALTTAQNLASIATKAWAAVQWLLNAALSANPIGIVVLAVGALIAAVVLLWKKNETFRKIVIAVWDAIKAAVQAVAKWFTDTLVPWIKGAFQKISAAIGAALNWVKKNWPLLLGILTGPIGLAVVLIAKNWDKIKAGVKAVRDFITARFNDVVGFIKGLPKRIAGAASGMWNGIKTAFKSAVNWIIDKWNGLRLKIGGQHVELPFGQSFDIPSITLNTPNIPRFHTGGIMPGAPGSEGLALLQAGERVTPAGRSGGQPLLIQISMDGRRMAQVLVDPLRGQIQQISGGNVQAALGKS